MSLEAQRSAFKQRALAQPTIVKANLAGDQALSLDHIPFAGSDPDAGADGRRRDGDGDDDDDDDDGQTKPDYSKRTFIPIQGGIPSTKTIAHQLYDIIDYLKQYKDTGQKFTRLELVRKLGYNPDHDIWHQLVINERVAFRDDTEQYSFKTKYDLRDKDALYRLLSKNKDRGIEVKDLREGWVDVVKAVAEMEAEGRVSIIRGKDGPKTVFWSDPQYKITISPEFIEYWRNTKVPVLPEELDKELARAGLKAMALSVNEDMDGAANEPIDKNQAARNKLAKRLAKQKQARRTNKRIKLTNQHLQGIDLTKDFVV